MTAGSHGEGNERIDNTSVFVCFLAQDLEDFTVSTSSWLRLYWYWADKAVSLIFSHPGELSGFRKPGHREDSKQVN